MSRLSTSSVVLAPSFQALRDVFDDFQRSATVETAQGFLNRWVQVLDEEPLRSFVESAAPERAFLPWWTDRCGGRISTSGSRSIDWPASLAERVGLQIGLCRAMSTSELDPFQTAHRYFNAGTKYVRDMYAKMAGDLLAPLLRDLGRLAEQRPVPTDVGDLLNQRPRSSDTHLDGLLAEACRDFRDPAPLAHRRAVEKLWDAWERVKTLDASDKKTSVAALLDRAAADNETLRRVLEDEAKALTAIGNDFHIRHHETNRTALVDPAHVDYLFRRMLAMLALVMR